MQALSCCADLRFFPAAIVAGIFIFVAKYRFWIK